MTSVVQKILERPLALAPMAGTTESIFRQICLEQGAGLVITELVSARGILYDTDFKRSKRYLQFAENEHPLAIQLFGSEPEDFVGAVDRICTHPLFGQCDLIDINMGCPVPKVVKQGSGSALMLNPDRAYRVMSETVVAAAKYQKPVTVKIRSGWDQANLNAVEIARLAEKAGVVMLAVHARTRDQFYAGEADYKQIILVKEAVSIPVWGNGDVKDVASYQRMLATGCDGVMIGRAAQGKPWIFRELTTGETLSAEQKLEIIKRHARGLVEQHGEYVGIREFRSQLAFYTKGMHNSAKLRSIIFQISNLDDLLAQIDSLASNL